jgi:hypothetical protein
MPSKLWGGTASLYQLHGTAQFFKVSSILPSAYVRISAPLKDTTIDIFKVTMAFRRIFFSLAATALFVHFASAAVGDTCFYPDGITTEPNHAPCNTTLSASACCDPLVSTSHP